jgi:predicted dehydrogenase
MVINLGIIGFSVDNGHPFSFASIINGFDPIRFVDSGWNTIYDYLKKRDPSEYGFTDVRVSHAWTQKPIITKQLCESCNILNTVENPHDMIGSVDAVIIARDDYETHFEMALPFLEAGLPVFVDKPLSLDIQELRAFLPYLESGRLMSCSGMRYAMELDEARAALESYGEIKLVRGAILNSWEKYGIHMLDAIFNVVLSRPMEILSLPASHSSFAISMDDGSLVQIDALGDVGRCFRVEIFGTKRITSHDITDNFSMFRRLLWHFVQSVKTGIPAIEPESTISAMRLLIAGREARKTKRNVSLDEIVI